MSPIAFLHVVFYAVTLLAAMVNITTHSFHIGWENAGHFTISWLNALAAYTVAFVCLPRALFRSKAPEQKELLHWCCWYRVISCWIVLRCSSLLYCVHRGERMSVPRRTWIQKHGQADGKDKTRIGAWKVIATIAIFYVAAENLMSAAMLMISKTDLIPHVPAILSFSLPIPVLLSCPFFFFSLF